MNWLKRKLRNWLVPEYAEFASYKEKMDLFMEEVAKAKHELRLIDKDITFEEPVVFLGSLHNCKVDVKPTLKPEIVLSKIDIPAGLISSGNHQFISGCLFQSQPTAVKLQTSEIVNDC